MTLNVRTDELNTKELMRLLEENLGQLQELRKNSEVLIMPDVSDQGILLNPHAIDLCTKFISKGVVAKMVIGDDFTTGRDGEGALSLPTIFTLKHDKDRTVSSVIGEYILAKAKEGGNVSFSFIIEDNGKFLKNLISGSLDEIGDIKLGVS